MGSNKGLVSPISHGTGFVSQLTKRAHERRRGGFRGRTWHASADPAIDSQLWHARAARKLCCPPYTVAHKRDARSFRSPFRCPFLSRGISGALSRTSKRGQSRGIPAASVQRERSARSTVHSGTWKGRAPVLPTERAAVPSSPSTPRSRAWCRVRSLCLLCKRPESSRRIDEPSRAIRSLHRSIRQASFGGVTQSEEEEKKKLKIQ
ncbi:hypothetical protein HPB50_001094 [Hyalomma asiaticum]|uniref:Uncharacterized protein n=1 Tax=Hyalomma asiaticum TaxID=266040 RepID=A0ACB7TAF3_HYAAI|nr:hypothetical protein HPB50_001094 [Hyalomma asiaticum]